MVAENNSSSRIVAVSQISLQARPFFWSRAFSTVRILNSREADEGLAWLRKPRLIL